MKYGFPLFTKPVAIVTLGGSEKLVISDIWAFWDYVIKKVSKDRANENFLKSLLEQAKHFYITAETSPIKSQPLLYYYSFLNFSKIIINLTGNHGSRKLYMHGVSETHNNKFSHSTIEKQGVKSKIVQVAPELVSVFDPQIQSTAMKLNVKELLNHCVGVHRAYSEIYNQKEVFIRIKDQKLYKNGKELIFKAELQCPPHDALQLKTQGYELTQEDDKFYYIEKIKTNSYTPTRQDYANLSAEIQKKGIWYFIGNNGYTMYLSNSSTGRFSQESIIYLVMFYLGSITRYHPYMFDEIFSAKEQWLMSEFLNTQPKQFLYLATAKVLGQSVVKAYASF